MVSVGGHLKEMTGVIPAQDVIPARDESREVPWKSGVPSHSPVMTAVAPTLYQEAFPRLPDAD